MMVTIRLSLSDLAGSDDVEEGEDENVETEEGKLIEDDKHGRVMDKITKMVQQCMEWFRQKQIKVDELRQLG